MVKTADELNSIGNTQADQTVEQKGSDTGPVVYLDELGSRHPNREEAEQADKRIRERLKSERTQITPAELRDLLG